MRVDVLTLFPGILQGFLNESILKIAQEKGLLEVRLHDWREFASDPRRTVDDKPFGGGPGMVLKPEPVFACLENLLAGVEPLPRMLLTTPQGERFTQAKARELAREPRLVILCGRYEGFDDRIRRGWPFEELSIGDYVLNGGETPAMAVIEAVTRLIPGVLGHDLSAAEESFEGGLLDHPHFTRPAVFRGMEVPEVLRSGDHAKVAAWRRSEALRLTRERRPDLLPADSEKDRDERPGRKAR
ncbi:MAG TPA: tRNA (guanosine(37)-N1)-methyltransferase TrmD [Planctomycetota bacterium]|nr:tRNA (guanosine(37)-N1)-methyltransferase TrmD [Planctomycetota bacterium]